MQKKFKVLSRYALLAIGLIFLMLSQPAIAQSSLEAAIHNYKLGKYSAALPQFQNLVRTSPSDANLHYYMGLCYQGLNRLSEAAKEYHWVVSFGRDSQLQANAQVGLGQLSRYSAVGRASATSTSTAHSANAPLLSASPPSVRDCLFAPKFKLKDGRTISAGKAWCARLPNGQTVLVSALHLLGPAGGLDSQVPANEVATVVQEVELTSLTDGSPTGSTTSVLSKSGFMPDNDDYSGDVIFFSAPAEISATRTLTLAEQPAAKGERCWFYTCRVDDTAAPQCFPGTVIESSIKSLEVKLDLRMETRATSGSPILDRSGKVIGMLHGHLERSGNLLCNPGCAIYRRIVSDTQR